MEKILLIQERARAQIRLYKLVEQDILNRMNSNIEQIKLRIFESPGHKSKYRDIKDTLRNMTESQKMAVIRELMDFYKI